MAAPLTLRHLENSSLVGQQQKYSQERVRIGRRAGNDLVFGGPQEMIVSGSHAELRAEGSGWVLADTGSTNGTFVEGKRVQGTVPLKPGARIMLGQGGPTFVVHWEDEVVVDVTMPMPGRGPGEARTLPARPAAAMPGPAVVPLPAPALAAAPVAAKQGIGMETLKRVLVQERAKERSRLLTLLAPAAVVLMAAVGLAVYLLGSGKGEVDWARVYAQVKPGVYLVCTRKGTPQGWVINPQATAWSYKPGWLATNAHVAALFEGLAADESLIVRSSDTPPKDLKIESVVFHPDQKVFAELFETYVPIEPDARMLSLQGQFDLALLKVAAEDQGKQAPPLPVADRKRAESLATGSAVSLVGYPQENRNINPQAPVPNNAPGTLSKRVDLFFGQPQSPDVTDILAYDLNSAGGASGSPVVDGSGVVIGLNAAGDYQRLSGMRIRAGLAYGPRVDLLEEIPTGGLAPGPTREQKLRALVERRFLDGIANAEVTARTVFERGLKDENVDLKEWEIVPDPVKTVGLSTKVLRQEIEVKEAEYFALMLVATQSPVRLMTRIRSAKSEDPKTPPVKYLWFVGPELLTQTGKITIEAQVSLEGSGFSTSRGKLIVLRARRK